MPSNTDGQTITADTSFQPDTTQYVYIAWPKALGDIYLYNDTIGAEEDWPYSQETGASYLDGPETPIEVTYDDGSGSQQWYVRRNDFPGVYDLGTTTYKLSFTDN